MSNISNRHNVLPFTAGESKALSGQRLARALYKPRGNNPAKYPSVCVSIPPIQMDDWKDRVNDLAPYISMMLENAQDGILKSLYESSDGALTSVSDDDISIAAIIGYLEAESTGSRLTREMVEKWFNENLADNLTVIVAEKLGFTLETPEQEQVVARNVNGYRELFKGLTGKGVILQDSQIRGLQRALEITSVDDEISEKLAGKLRMMTEKPKMEELLEL